MFIVSIKGRYGEVKLARNEVIERWDPLWQQRNEEFESQSQGRVERLEWKASPHL